MSIKMIIPKPFNTSIESPLSKAEYDKVMQDLVRTYAYGDLSVNDVHRMLELYLRQLKPKMLSRPISDVEWALRACSRDKTREIMNYGYVITLQDEDDKDYTMLYCLNGSSLHAAVVPEKSNLYGKDGFVHAVTKKFHALDDLTADYIHKHSLPFRSETKRKPDVNRTPCGFPNAFQCMFTEGYDCSGAEKPEAWTYNFEDNEYILRPFGSLKKSLGVKANILVDAFGDFEDAEVVVSKATVDFPTVTGILSISTHDGRRAAYVAAGFRPRD